MRFRLLKNYNEELSIVFLGQIFSIIAMIFSIKIITNLMTQKDFGYFSYWMTIFIGFNQLIYGPLSGAFNRFYSFSVNNNRVTDFFTIIKEILIKISLIIFILYSLIVILALILNLEINLSFLTLLILYVVFNGVYVSIISIHSAKRNRRLIAILSGFEPLIRVVLFYSIVIFFFSSPNNLIAAYTISSFIVLVISLYYLIDFVKSNNAFSKDLPPLKDEILKYSRYTSYWGVFTWVYLSSDKWLIEYFFGEEEVAVFVVLLQLGYYPMSLISGILNQFLAPIFFEKLNNLNKNTLYFDNLNKKLVIAILILTLIISVFVFFSHEYIFEIFTSESYYEYSYLLPYLILSGGIFSASQVLTMTYQYKLEIKKLMSGKIVTSCIGISSNFIAAYFFSLHAMAISSVIFSIANIIYFYLHYNKLESNMKIN